METSTRMYLSYKLAHDTPTYRDSLKVTITKKSDISECCVSNSSHIAMDLHIGTHIDFPNHFYKDGQDESSYSANYLFSSNIAAIFITPKNTLIRAEDLEPLIKDIPKETEVLLLKTGFCEKRNQKTYTNENPGIASSCADLFRKNLPNIKIFGFDLVSLSGFFEREEGRKSHWNFLNPKNPILLIEDMDLSQLHQKTEIVEIDVVPFRIEHRDGLPCTVVAKIAKPS